ncbi:YopT-type cysteine protease domain-containing protein [Aquabacterium sp.]|uniref:YopT-type cysteine protease domain-containing protein n=1 Tax=Aquabacterium sp. TaxID=1872578 RepID=UPI002B93B95D|nr:YopT-type cysteine protease domain-containing protein [Aquabacterium sp.]HSW03338.1 YopT-type cysteine protease domain-containing protein [Aquabacterium sp.]
MDNFVDFLVNRVVMSISPIRASATTYHGQCTWHFSQCKDPVRSLIATAETTKNGICEILAAKWVALEVGNNTTLVNWLAGGGTGHRSQLDLAKLALLAQTFGTAGGGEAQGEATRAWMETQRVRQHQTFDMGGATQRGTAKFNLDHLLGDLRRRVTARTVGNPLIALITVAEQNRWLGYKGHIMAVRIHAGGNPVVKYFDPNYGEFTFNSFANFSDWFRSYFRDSHYQDFLGTYYKLRYFTA